MSEKSYRISFVFVVLFFGFLIGFNISNIIYFFYKYVGQLKNMNTDTLSIIITIVSLAWAVFERFQSAKDKADIKASIRNWQHLVKGLSSSINRLSYSCNDDTFGRIYGVFSEKKDVGIALGALHEISESLADSLYESRFFSEKELKDILKKNKEKEEREKEETVKENGTAKIPF